MVYGVKGGAEVETRIACCSSIFIKKKKSIFIKMTFFILSRAVSVL